MTKSRLDTEELSRGETDATEKTGHTGPVDTVDYRCG
jgi:hypothetical protein